ncbi:MAG: uracil-DNA glycosylase [Pseudotabrizicola sp.]|uniref:uracil-DNA glycosylase n=1 Tax=Pseudotabrizicola sp. TaxID=2939647 RepID=UPI002726775F|nr:uracil-DNA glycosylase [Pseudotabrizicola sp.]MDO9639848.1 uracil-DNA glycosylase [Pseudotabrizicola sp.]
MGIATDILTDWHASQAALLWQVDLGIDEWLLDDPLNRYDLPEAVKPAPMVAPAAAPATRVAAPVALPEVAKVDAVAEAQALAARAGTLDALRAAIAGFEHCDLRRGARNLVFADGVPGARVMVLGEAPGPEEDREGRPFVGRAGALLDEMFAAIGLSRDAQDARAGLYLAHILPWRCLGNGAPLAEDVAMMLPFVMRHIDLVAPEVIVVMGNTPLSALTGVQSIARARGQWQQAGGRAVLPMIHPDSLLRTPVAKREAWDDLLALEARLAK